jgi:hypothetical protein
LAGLREHLDSPQFPDEDPDTEAETQKSGLSLAKFSGGWVAPGKPRSRGYLFYVISLVSGAFLALTGQGGFDLLAFGGLAFIALGIFGIAETFRGKRFPRP